MALVGRWTFAGLGGPWDETESWQELELHGGATLSHRGLELKKGAWAMARLARGSSLKVTRKTLISWVVLNDLTDKRPAGSALTLEVGRSFDAIDFGENADCAWMVGSDDFLRSSDSSAPEITTGTVLKMAISFGTSAKGEAEMSLYRNDVLVQTFTKGLPMVVDSTGAIALFGARWRLRDDSVFGHLDATVVAAEIHDEALSAAEIAARTYDDPSAYLVRSTSLQAVGTGGCLAVAEDRTVVVPAQLQSTDADRQRATWVVMPGLADPTLVSLRALSPAGSYLYAPGQTVSVQPSKGTRDFRAAATFRMVPGKAGVGFGLEPLSQPGTLLRRSGTRIWASPANADGTVPDDGTFTFREPFLAEVTTALPLDQHAYYLISAHDAAPGQVLGVKDGVIGPQPLPQSGEIRHLQWRVQPPTPNTVGLHLWKLVNSKTNSALTIGTSPAITGDGNVVVRPVPWMGTDYFSIVDAGGTGQALTSGAGGALGTAAPDLAAPGQLWRFTFMRLGDGVQPCVPPARIEPRMETGSHEDYAATYPKYLGALGMDYVATESSSDWALIMARTVLTNVLLGLRDRSKIALLKDYRILMVSDGDGDEAADYLDIRNPEFKTYRGQTDSKIARVTEEMMCRTGVTHVPSDKTTRTYDQVVHEFGHSIDRLFGLFSTRQSIGMTDVEVFPCVTQAWFDSDTEYAVTRAKVLADDPADRVAFYRSVFLANREWRPYPVWHDHGDPAAALVSAADKAAAAATSMDAPGG